MIKVDLRAVWRVNVRGVERELDEMLIAVLGGLERTEKLGGATFFGLEAAAVRFHLGFVKVATERYYLAFTSASIEREDVRAFLDAAREPAFLEAVGLLPGYRPCMAGDLQGADALLGRIPAGLTIPLTKQGAFQ